MMRFRRYSVELYRELGVFETVGSVRIASSEESLLDLRRGGEPRRGIGLDVELISPDEAPALMPDADRRPDLRRRLDGRRRLRRPAHRDLRGRRRRARARASDPAAHAVTGIELGARRGWRRCSPSTAGSRPSTSSTPRASGRRRSRRWWARSSRRCRSTTSTSRWRRWRGTRCPRDAPCFRDTDNLVYGKAEAGGMLIGGYEPNRRRAGWTACRGSTARARCRRTWTASRRCWRGRSAASRSSRMPAWSRLLCHPDAMTPDGNPLLGPMPDVPRLLGRRRALAERLRRRRRPRPGSPSG